MYSVGPQSAPEFRTVEIIGRISSCTNPEGAELLPDGEAIIFGNCQLVRNHTAYWQGCGNVQVRGEALISRVRNVRRDRTNLEERFLITGLTATLGGDVLRKATSRFPTGVPGQHQWHNLRLWDTPRNLVSTARRSLPLWAMARPRLLCCTKRASSPPLRRNGTSSVRYAARNDHFGSLRAAIAACLRDRWNNQFKI